MKVSELATLKGSLHLVAKKRNPVQSINRAKKKIEVRQKTTATLKEKTGNGKNFTNAKGRRNQREGKKWKRSMSKSQKLESYSNI
jgi:hypothetical protein